MATIVTRSGKGSALTHNEADANFTNLNTDKLELVTGPPSNNNVVLFDGTALNTQLKDAGYSFTNLSGAVTSTAAELNILDGATVTYTELNYLDLTTGAGTAEASKAVVLDGSKNIGTLGTVTMTSLVTTNFTLGGTAVTSTAAELNILDGVTATAAELNYVDVTTVGTAQASKAVILDASKNITGLGTISSGSITSSGTITGSTVNATTLQIGGVSITSTAAELNKLDGFTGVVGDLNIIAGGAAAGVTATEFQYLNGVTSAIQTQINTKLTASSNLSDLTNAATARTNLGLGSLAVENTIGPDNLDTYTAGTYIVNTWPDLTNSGTVNLWTDSKGVIVPTGGVVRIRFYKNETDTNPTSSYRIQIDGIDEVAETVFGRAADVGYATHDITVAAGEVVTVGVRATHASSAGDLALSEVTMSVANPLVPSASY